MEVKRQKEDGTTTVLIPDQCFTEESNLTVVVPTYTQKTSLIKRIQETKDDPESNYKIICEMVDSVEAWPVDSEEKITSFDDLTAFCDANLIIEWLTNLMINGFVPKKKSTV